MKATTAGSATTAGTAGGLTGNPAITVASVSSSGTVSGSSFSGLSTSLNGAYWAGDLGAGFSVASGGSGVIPWSAAKTNRITIDGTNKIFTIPDTGLYIALLNLNSDFNSSGNITVAFAGQNSEWNTTWNGSTEFKAFFYINVTVANSTYYSIKRISILHKINY